MLFKDLPLQCTFNLPQHLIDSHIFMKVSQTQCVLVGILNNNKTVKQTNDNAPNWDIKPNVKVNSLIII